MSKKPAKKWQGLNPHRYKDNPLEHKIALAWEKLNAPQGPSTDKTLLDDLLADYLPNKVMGMGAKVAVLTPGHERLIVNTLIQWLGSPVGFGWLKDTLGPEIVRSLRDHGSSSGVEPGQVYRSLDKRDEGRQVRVERLRYGTESRHANAWQRYWTVQNAETGRRSYVRERILLDRTKWGPVL